MNWKFDFSPETSDMLAVIDPGWSTTVARCRDVARAALRCAFACGRRIR